MRGADGAAALAQFTQVTPEFSVAGQLSPDDIKAAAAAGFRRVVNNRPDGESSGQMSAAEARAAAEAAGLSYREAAFAGAPSMAAVDAEMAALEGADGPVLAYCRTGTRSITAWALAQAKAGARTPEELVQLAAGAGYDLAHWRAALEQLAAMSRA